MHPRRSIAAAALLLFGVASAGEVQTTSAQGLSLRYRWTKGETLRYRTSTQSHVTMSNMPGVGDITVNTNLIQVQQLVVENVGADGTATLKVKFESLKMDMTTPMGNMTYDSASPPTTSDPMTDVIAKSVGALVGETITLVLTPVGSIAKIDGLDVLVKKITATMPAGVGGMPGMNSLVSEDTVRTTLEQSFSRLPDQPVKPGETWKHASKIKMAIGVIDTAMTFTLKGVQTQAGREVATIAVAATNQVAMDSSATAALPMTMTMGAGTSQGEILFDTKAGRVQRATFQGNQPMSMTMTGPDGSSISIDATTKTNMTIELVEK